MRIPVYISATFFDDDGQPITGGFRTHVITLSNEDALERLVEHFGSEALYTLQLTQDDCLVYDNEID